MLTRSELTRAADLDEHQACCAMAARSGSSSAMALALALSCWGELGLFGARLSRLP